MTAYRSRKEMTPYRKRIKLLKTTPNVCEFCDLKQGDEQFVGETAHFKMVRNIHPYTLWDERRVKEHLLIMPKAHVETLAKLSAKAQNEFVKLIIDYEANGYDIFARTAENKMKSVVHQHTHLIKTGGKRRHILFFTRKPYFRISL